MSKLRKKPTGLNMGFENIVLLNEFQEEIDVPPVIKTPLGNYLVVYSKLDTVLLSPEIFGAWSARHGATGFAALDEDVEEVEEPLFCLRFASEILSTNADKTLGAPPVEDVASEHHLVGNTEQDVVAPQEQPVVAPVGDVQTGENLICEYNRAPPIAQLLDSPLDLGTLLQGTGVLTVSQYHRYCTAVEFGLTVCNTVGHIHVTNDRSVFYQWDKGPLSMKHGKKVLSFVLVRAPDQPKDPCACNGIPLHTWVPLHGPDINLFGHEVLHQITTEWRPEMQPVRDKLCEFTHEPVAFIKEFDKEATKYLYSISDGAYVFGKAYRDHPGSSPRESPSLLRAVATHICNPSIR